MEQVTHCAKCGADQDGGLDGLCWQCGEPWDTKPDRPHRMIGVAAYTCGEVQRVYGGPEEGGWYYDDFEPQRVLMVPAAKAERCERLLQRWQDHQNAGRPKLSSVLSNGRAQWRTGIEGRTPRPHYE
jgi:hypothetical protein